MPVMRRVLERLVFIDETSVKTNLTRLRGRSVRGARLTGSAPFGKWGTQTLIAGLTQDGMVASWVIKGAMDGDAFAAYVRKVLVPELLSGTCVFSITSPPITTPRPAKPCVRRGAVFSSCHLTLPTRARSNKRSQSSKRTSDASAHVALLSSSKPSAKSAICSARENAGTAFMLQDMFQYEVERL